MTNCGNGTLVMPCLSVSSFFVVSSFSCSLFLMLSIFISCLSPLFLLTLCLIRPWPRDQAMSRLDLHAKHDFVLGRALCPSCSRIPCVPVDITRQQVIRNRLLLGSMPIVPANLLNHLLEVLWFAQPDRRANSGQDCLKMMLDNFR